MSYGGLYALTSVNQKAVIIDEPFVAGTAIRVSWGEIEKTEGNYDWSILDDAVTRAGAVGQSVALLLLASGAGGKYGMPAYLAAGASQTYDVKGNQCPVPQDPYLQGRYRALLESMPHKDGGVFRIMHPPIAGTPEGSLRNRGRDNVLSSMPGYEDFIPDAIYPQCQIFNDTMPNLDLYAHIWQDSNPDWPEQKAAVQAHGLGCWMDNLGDDEPVEHYGAPLADSLFTGFQMLTSWTQPMDSGHAEKIAGSDPEDGIAYGYNFWGARYFEVYANDLQNPEYRAGFEKWAPIIEGDDGPTPPPPPPPPPPEPPPEPELATVPAVIGKSRSVALQDIAAAGLVAIITESYSEVTAGIIASQTPAAFVKVEPESNVHIVASLGQEPAPPPPPPTRPRPRPPWWKRWMWWR